MKKIAFVALLSVFSLNVWGQTKLSEAQTSQIIEKIDKSAKTMSTMQCDFTQTKSMKMLNKEMVSTGSMYYKTPNKLRWQYTSPYDYIFVLSGDKVSMKSAKSTKNIDVQGNKMFRKITDIILNCITGGSLKSSADFKLEVYKSDNIHFAKLYPKKKEMKQLYTCIELYFNPELTFVNTVKMQEKTGDITTVKLTNIKTNVTINEKMFSVD